MKKKFRQLFPTLLVFLTIWNGPGQFVLANVPTSNVSRDSFNLMEQIDQEDEFLDETMLLPENVKNKQKLRKRIIIVSGVIVAIAATIAGFYFYDQNDQNEQNKQNKQLNVQLNEFLNQGKEQVQLEKNQIKEKVELRQREQNQIREQSERKQHVLKEFKERVQLEQNQIKEQAIQDFYDDPENQHRVNLFKHEMKKMESKKDAISSDRAATSQKLNQDIEDLKQEVKEFKNTREKLIEEAQGKDGTFQELNNSISLHYIEEKIEPLSDHLDKLADAGISDLDMSLEDLNSHKEAALVAVDDLLNKLRTEKETLDEKRLERNRSQSYSQKALKLGKLFVTSIFSSRFDGPQYELSSEMGKLSDHLTGIKDRINRDAYSTTALDAEQKLLQAKAVISQILAKRIFTVAPEGLCSGSFCILSDEINYPL